MDGNLFAGIEIKNSAKLTRYLFSGPLTRVKKYSQSRNSVSRGNFRERDVLRGSGLDDDSHHRVDVVHLHICDVCACRLGSRIVHRCLLLASALRLANDDGSALFAVWAKPQKGSVDTGGAILEMVDGFREIAVLSKQNFFLTRFIEAKKLSARTGVALQILKSLPRYIAEAGLILGALGFVVWQLSRGSLGEGPPRARNLPGWVVPHDGSNLAVAGALERASCDARLGRDGAGDPSEVEG